MVLSPKAYRKLLGLSEGTPSREVSKLLESMMSKSIGDSMVQVEVEVLGTEETQDLSVLVSTKAQEEVTT